MVEWNGISRLFQFSGILGQPREVHPKFRNEIPENVCSIRSQTRNFRNFWSNGKRPRSSFRHNPTWWQGIQQENTSIICTFQKLYFHWTLITCNCIVFKGWEHCSVVRSLIDCVHDGHVGGPKQYNDFPLGNIFYFYANIFYCFSPPTWPPCTHSILSTNHVRRCKQCILLSLYQQKILSARLPQSTPALQASLNKNSNSAYF